MESAFLIRSHFSGFTFTHPKYFFGDFLAHLRAHFIPHHTNNYHPHIFSHRMTSLFAALLVSVKIFSLAYLTLGPAIPALSSAITEENIIALTNLSRQSFGYEHLIENSLLKQAAQKKADDMAQKGYFAHNSPDGRTPWSFIKAAGYKYIMAGENLAVNFTQAENVESAWMNSPSHKANILNKNFEQIGIGIAQGEYNGRESTFVVQMFGTPSEQEIVLKNEPTQVVSLIPEPATKIIVTQPTLEIKDATTQIDGSNLIIKTVSSSNATRVLAIFGQKAVMLNPKTEDQWSFTLPISDLVSVGQSLIIKAFNINGQTAQKTIASFADNTLKNFNFVSAGKVAGKSISIFGQNMDLQNFEYRFYLLFVVVILTALILAIAIKRHIQHLTVVANGSFAAMLAILLWMG